MIRNPYPIPSEEDKISCRFQTYLSGEDKGLLSSIRPIRGTPQAVVNHLIKNLCDDLRDIKLISYHPDADNIFSILVERRPLTADQLARIRRAIAGTHKSVSTGIQHDRGGTEVRKGLTSPPSGTDHPPFKVVGGKQPDRQAKSKKNSKTKTNR